MDILQTFLLALGLMGFFVLIILAFSGTSTQKTVDRRLEGLKLRHSDSVTVKTEAQMKRAIANRMPRMNGNGGVGKIEMIRRRLAMTGKNWKLKQYFGACAGIGAFIFIALLARTGQPLISAIVALGAGLGIPHFIVGIFMKSRVKKFTSSFPDAIELLVRGLRSGLPVTETLQVVASEIPGPVGEEFRMVTERIKIGRSMEEALEESAIRLDTPEFSFFCITLAIQRETGGNLAETLANLADVLRKRAQMKLKIKALSSESKASAYIVGSLPFLVFAMIWWINPDYLGGFFSEQRLIIAGVGGMIWMSIGAFIMAKMVSFEI